MRAKQAGFDLIYVYAGHGLGIFQHFLSRATNFRTDEYGGSLENRARLLREVIEDTKDAVGDTCAVPVRIAMSEFMGSAGLEPAEVEGGELEVEAAVDLDAVRPDLAKIAHFHHLTTDAARAEAAEGGRAALLFPQGGTEWVALLREDSRLPQASGCTGLYHLAASGRTSWHGFAEAIVSAMPPEGRKCTGVEPIATAEYPTAAKRPAFSVLCCDKLKRTFGLQLPDWHESLLAALDVEREPPLAVARASAASPQPALSPGGPEGPRSGPEPLRTGDGRGGTSTP